MASSRALIVPALKRHTATVIVAHGLGDSGAGWVFLAENWRRRGKFEEVRFIFPNAPSIPITLNMGMRMPGWYDIRSLDDIKQREDEAGVIRSRDYLQSLIAAEVKEGIPSHRIVVGGFSQGGALALLTGATSAPKLGGIFGLSSYLVLHETIRSMIPDGNPNQDTPIFMGHGDRDWVVRYDWGKKTAETLRGWGYKVDFRTYAGVDHTAPPEEIDHLEAYLAEQIPPLD